MKTLMLPAPHPKVVARYEFEKYPLIGSLGLIRKLDVLELRDGMFVKVGTQEVAGVQAMLRGAFIVRAWINNNSKTELLKTGLEMERLVRRELPGHSIMPSHPGWGGRTITGKMYYNYMFAAEETGGANSANSRLTRLIGHLDSRSRYLGKAVVAILTNDILEKADNETGNKFNYLAMFSENDGSCLLRPGCIKMPFDDLKIYANSNMGPGYLKAGAPTVKGVAEVSKHFWKIACELLGVAYDDVDIIVPEISMKFQDHRTIFAADLFSVFDTISGNQFTLTNQMMVNMAYAMTPEMNDMVVKLHKDAAAALLKDLSDPSGMAVAKRLAAMSPHLEKILKDNGASDFECEEARETISAFISAVVSGLPYETSKYLKRCLPILCKGAFSRFALPGSAFYAKFDFSLGKNEISLSPEEWKSLCEAYNRKYGKDPVLGEVSVMTGRNPNTGSELGMCTVVGNDRNAINPLYWKEWYLGDGDGDYFAIAYLFVFGLFKPFYEELIQKYIDMMPARVKGKTNLTVAEAVAAGAYSQFKIPEADALLRKASELGLPLEKRVFIRKAINDIINMAKEDGEVDLEAVAAEVGIPLDSRPSALQDILCGRFGKREYTLMTYNVRVEEAREERTEIEWANRLRESGFLFNIFAGNGDSDYASLLKYLKVNDISKGGKFNLVVSYISCLNKHGLEEMVGYSKNHEPQAVIPAEIVNSTRGQALLAKAESIGLLPRMTARRCFDSYKLFLENIRRGDVTTTQAYQPIRDAVTLVRESEHGDAAMKWLFASLVFNCDPNIRMKAMNILTYMPLKVGSYNLRKVLEFLGYERKFNLIITR